MKRFYDDIIESQRQHEQNVVPEFLDFLSKTMPLDVEENNLATSQVWNRIKQLTEGMDVSLDDPLEDDEEEDEDWDWDDCYPCGCCSCCGCYCDSPTDRFGNPKEDWEEDED